MDVIIAAREGSCKQTGQGVETRFVKIDKLMDVGF